MKDKGVNLTLKETLTTIKKQAASAWLEWTDEVNADFSSEIEFLLGLKGRWLLCHMGKDYPYTIRFRLIWEKDYTRVRPRDFIEKAKQLLLH